VNEEGSGDMYYKGANVVHMVRHIMGDEAFKAMLLGLQRTYRHRIVSSAEVEAYMDSCTTEDLRPLFDQYLRTTKVPVLEWGVKDRQLIARWTDCDPGFTMRVGLVVNGKPMSARIGTAWWTISSDRMKKAKLEVDRNWYVKARGLTADELKQVVLSSSPLAR
jgi:hypothetical protein